MGLDARSAWLVMEGMDGRWVWVVSGGGDPTI
jgi:hypothetical protein